MTFDLNFPRAHGEPLGTAELRATNNDFVVHEHLGFEPSGEGEHVYLHLEKNGDNTPWLARQIAKLAGTEVRDVGYCGLKDRHAVTRQWFSVYLPAGPEPDWQALASDTVRLLTCTRHRQKLRRGQHQCNEFTLWLRTFDGDKPAVQRRLEQVKAQGVPNYFGEQRFGIDAGNLHAAERLLVAGTPIKNREKRFMVLSAARSWLFNQVLAERVRQQNWHRCLPGEALQREWPTGPLWGRGRPSSAGEALALESAVLAHWHPWCGPLEFTGLKQDRRALVSLPQRLQWQWRGEDLQLQFSLAVGAYATAVVREIIR